ATMYAANAAIRLKHYDDAEKHYSDLQQRGVALPEMFSNISEIYLAKGDTAKAEEAIAKGRQLFPNDKQLMIDELNIVLFAKDCKKAIEKLKEAIKISPDLNVLYVRLGDSYDKCNDTANSHAAYETAIEKDPGNLVGYYQLGISYYNIAANLNNEMLKLPDSQQKQIDALRAKRDALFRKSLVYLEHARQINGKDMDTLVALRQVYARLNMLDKVDEIKKEIEALGG
ncbi:MAG TPA: tetratricopeptide repeat protein, partial [Chitinophagales bacterium]|nr:tetratricopeptide repeat protein [Chitinophagales bacterium]